MRLCFLIVNVFFINYISSQENDICKCVTYYWCNQTSGTVITTGLGLFNERLGNVCNCSCPEGEVCCLTPETRSLPTRICGKRNIKGIGYRSDSFESANFGEFPWVVDILEDGDIHKCGGSLIHPSVVLTAAHCVIKKKTYIVRAGDWDNSDTYENIRHQDLLVSSVVTHENYNPAVYYNDIALLFLKGSFNLTGNVQTICLPKENTQYEKNECYVVGRGKDLDGKYQAILKKIELSLVEKDVCEKQLKATNKLGRNFKLQRSFVCAGGERDKDACIGDGGGPLVCPIKNQNNSYLQVGIVSWGIGCHQEGVPGVYASVVFLNDWITKQLNSKNIVF